MRISLVFCLLLLGSETFFSQDSDKFFSKSKDFNKKKYLTAVSVQAVGYSGSLVLLSRAWYESYNKSRFHFFDDSREWLQMDKAGHLTTAYYLGRAGIDMMQWSGAETRKSILYGAAGSFLYLTGIEVLDGFSDGWGFSLSDFSANTLGTALIIEQKFLQSKNHKSLLINGVGEMSLKFSFHQTDYPQYRQSVLGKNLAENILKDYNGQTYWLSCNISSFIREETKFPRWLNLAFGYGAEGMTGGKENPPFTDISGNSILFDRYRKYYFSLDIDLTRIKTKSAFLKTVFETFSFLKIPAPAIEVSSKRVKWYAIYPILLN